MEELQSNNLGNIMSESDMIHVFLLIKFPSISPLLY